MHYGSDIFILYEEICNRYLLLKTAHPILTSCSKGFHIVIILALFVCKVKRPSAKSRTVFNVKSRVSFTVVTLVFSLSLSSLCFHLGDSNQNSIQNGPLSPSLKQATAKTHFPLPAHIKSTRPEEGP